jgi:hypothetical protein
MTTHVKVFVCILIGLIVFGIAPRAVGDSGSVAYTFGSPLFSNESKYVLYYSIPPVIQTGFKTNFTFFIYLTELSGWKYDSERQYLTITINTQSATVGTQKVNNTVFLYQGGRWGPFNLTFDLSVSQVGLSPGGVTNATAYANLVVYEHYDDPKFPFLVDDGATLKLTDFKISSPPSSSGLAADRLLVSFAVGATVVAALGGVTLVSRKRSHPGTNSHALCCAN